MIDRIWVACPILLILFIPSDICILNVGDIWHIPIPVFLNNHSPYYNICVYLRASAVKKNVDNDLKRAWTIPNQPQINADARKYAPRWFFDISTIHCFVEYLITNAGTGNRQKRCLDFRLPGSIWFWWFSTICVGVLPESLCSRRTTHTILWILGIPFQSHQDQHR